MLSTLWSILTLVRPSRNIVVPLVYLILARMLLFFEKLKFAIKDVIISHSTFDGHSTFSVQATRVQASKVQASRFQAFRLSKSKSIDYKNRVQVFRHAYYFNVTTQRLNCLYKFHRFLLTSLPKLLFPAPLIKIHQRSLIFIEVNSVWLHPKTKYSPCCCVFPVFR